MTTLFEAKGQARRLAEYLSSLNLTLNHSQALEAVARSHGAQSWNVFSNQVQAEDAAPPQTGAHAPPNPAFATLAGLLEHAREHEYGSVHILARKNAITIRQRVRGVLRLLATLDCAEGLSLGMEMAALFKAPARPFQSATIDVNGHAQKVLATRLSVMGGTDTVLRFPRLPVLHELGITELRTWSRLVRNTPCGLVLVGGDYESAMDIINATAGARILNESGIATHAADNKKWIGFPDIQDPEDYHKTVMASLRADPSVIVTEIRSAGSLADMLQAAEGGGLVIAAVQSLANPRAVLQRLLSLVPKAEIAAFQERLQGSLTAILSQVSAHPECDHCDGKAARTASIRVAGRPKFCQRCGSRAGARAKASQTCLTERKPAAPSRMTFPSRKRSA